MRVASFRVALGLALALRQTVEALPQMVKHHPDHRDSHSLESPSGTIVTVGLARSTDISKRDASLSGPWQPYIRHSVENPEPQQPCECGSEDDEEDIHKRNPHTCVCATKGISITGESPLPADDVAALELLETSVLGKEELCQVGNNPVILGKRCGCGCEDDDDEEHESNKRSGLNKRQVLDEAEHGVSHQSAPRRKVWEGYQHSTGPLMIPCPCDNEHVLLRRQFIDPVASPETLMTEWELSLQETTCMCFMDDLLPQAYSQPPGQLIRTAPGTTVTFMNIPPTPVRTGTRVTPVPQENMESTIFPLIQTAPETTTTFIIPTLVTPETRTTSVPQENTEFTMFPLVQATPETTITFIIPTLAPPGTRVAPVPQENTEVTIFPLVQTAPETTTTFIIPTLVTPETRVTPVPQENTEFTILPVESTPTFIIDSGLISTTPINIIAPTPTFCPTAVTIVESTPGVLPPGVTTGNTIPVVFSPTLCPSPSTTFVEQPSQVFPTQSLLSSVSLIPTTSRTICTVSTQSPPVANTFSFPPSVFTPSTVVGSSIATVFSPTTSSIIIGPNTPIILTPSNTISIFSGTVIRPSTSQTYVTSIAQGPSILSTNPIIIATLLPSTTYALLTTSPLFPSRPATPCPACPNPENSLPAYIPVPGPAVEASHPMGGPKAERPNRQNTRPYPPKVAKGASYLGGNVYKPRPASTVPVETTDSEKRATGFAKRDVGPPVLLELPPPIPTEMAPSRETRIPIVPWTVDRRSPPPVDVKVIQDPTELQLVNYEKRGNMPSKPSSPPVPNKPPPGVDPLYWPDKRGVEDDAEYVAGAAAATASSV